MPGPVSDSYDPEFGTADNACQIRRALWDMYAMVSGVLSDRSPVYVSELVHDLTNRQGEITATMTERQWRLLRFALERAINSL